MPWKPEVPREVPTLGGHVIDWVEEWIADPAGSDRIVLTREQQTFVLRFYELDSETGARRHRRGLLSRPKGWGRSPFAAALAIAESFAPVVPDGWDANGRPVGRPWATVRPVWTQLLAVSRSQVSNCWHPLKAMMTEGPLINEPGVAVLESYIRVPRGRIEPVTASAVSREGNQLTFGVLDQTESWTEPNGGARLAAVVRRNAAKTSAATFELPNAYRPGMQSVAEASFDYARRIARGEARDDGLLHDHREAPALADLDDDADVLDALRVAYGDSAGGLPCVLHDPPCAPQVWGAPLARIARERLDLNVTPEDWRLYHLNQPTSPESAFVTEAMLDALPKPRRANAI
jgi:hypothetical protein